MASRTSSSFMVYIYQCEIDEIRKQFQQRRKKECSGDLFGLWTSSGHAVVHFVSGITETSRNSSAVSRQDRRNELNILLEKKYMLCHIGKWRFNPSVTSSEPSESDKAAVEHFYSRDDGHKACILLKFNERKADIQAYLFVGRNEQVLANLSILCGCKSSNEVTENPLRNVPAIREKLQSGTPLSTSQSQGSNSRSNSWETFGNESGEPAKSPSVQTLTLFLSSQPSSSQTTSTPPPQPVPPTDQSSARLQGIQPANSLARSPSSSTAPKPAPKLNDARENILKQVQEKVTSIVKDLKTVVSPREPSTGDVELKLEVNQIKCTVQFPLTFPEKPAKVFCRLPKQPYIFKVKHPTDDKFDAVDSILSAVKWCFEYHIGHSSSRSANPITTTARQATEDSPCSEAPDNVDHVEVDVLKFAEEVRDKIKETFEITGDVGLEMKTKKSGKKVELTFQHYHNDKKWLIVLPDKFREQFTQIYYVTVVGDKTYVGQDVYGVSDQIIKFIRKSCACVPCFCPN